MIYLITSQEELKSKYKKISIEESLRELNKLTEIYVDTETVLLDPYLGTLVSAQLGDDKNQYFIDCTSVDIKLYKDLLESKLLIMHNAKFDLKWLYHNRIVPTEVYDTFLVERTLYLGISTHRAGLKECVERYCGITLEKEERSKIDGVIRDTLIQYGCLDITYLPKIREEQLKLVRERELEVSIQLDNAFVLVLAYIEYCGMKMDTNRWLKRLGWNSRVADKCIKVLNKFILDNNIKEFIDRQLSLFSTEIQVTINWDSPKQVVSFLNLLGVDTKIIKKGENKDTSDEALLLKNVKDYPILKALILYRGYQKDISTYGQNWIDQINPISGRIHTSFKQLMNTGRLSSGGKDKVSGDKYPNFQNIPSDKYTRSCFIAEKGNKIIARDYSGQENIVLVNQCLDENLLEFYDGGHGDLHSFVVTKMYDDLANMSLKDIKKFHPEKRQECKVAGFAIAYGGTAMAIAEQLNKPIEVAEKVYNGYFKAFPGLKDYQNESKKFGLENGYVILSKVTNKRSYVDFYDQYKELQKEIDSDFWDNYKYLKRRQPGSYKFLEMKSKVRKYVMKRGDIERMSLNFPVQGESSEITKLACVYFWRDYLIPNNLLFKVLVTNMVHDEILTEQSEELTEKTNEALGEAMTKAGKVFCKRVELKSESSIGDYWIH